MTRRKKRAESRARYYIRAEAAKRGWNTGHVSSSGDFLEENEIVAHFPSIGLGQDKPDFLVCLAGEPAIVIEAKNDPEKTSQAIYEAIEYSDRINATSRYKIKLAVGAAGNEDSGFTVEVRFLSPAGWQPLTSYGHEITTIPSLREFELAIAADDATTEVSVPYASEFIDAAIELSVILRNAKVEAPLRPKVIGAMVAAMYEGEIDIDSRHSLGSVNQLCDDAINSAVDLQNETKLKLVDALRLSGADFDRLAPSIGRIVAILRRLNVRAVLQTDTDFLGMFYEAFLRYGYDNNALGIVFTPRHITRFCVQLTRASVTDRVIDVACGTGGFLVAALDEMSRQARSSATSAKIKSALYGFDTNPTVWALAMLNMFFRGDGKSNIILGSCFDPKNVTATKGQFSRAYLNPPFSQQSEPEKDFLDAAMRALEPEGMLAAVVYAGIFADEDHKEWRRQFLRKHSLLGMISLPEDLFYPTAAPTSIILAHAHVPQQRKLTVMMGRIWNDGFEKLKNRRVERPGSQLPTICDEFQRYRAGGSLQSELATLIEGGELLQGQEWSPQEWLPQPHISPEVMNESQELAMRSVYQAVAHFPDLADEVLEDFGDAWVDRPDLPAGLSIKVL